MKIASTVTKIIVAAASTAALGTLLIAATPNPATADECDEDYAVERGYRYVPQYREWSRRHHEPDLDDYPVICDSDGDDCRPNPVYEGRYYRPAQPRYFYNYPVFRGFF